jgi:hypothetical protein
MVETSGAGCNGPLNHENAANLIAGRFQHLQGTLSISFGIRRASVGRAGECLALSVLPIGSDA